MVGGNFGVQNASGGAATAIGTQVQTPVTAQSFGILGTPGSTSYNTNAQVNIPQDLNSQGGSSTAPVTPVTPANSSALNQFSYNNGVNGLGQTMPGYKTAAQVAAATPPDITSQVGTTQPVTSGLSPTTNNDVQNSMAGNITAYMNGMANNQQALDAHNQYMQALNNYQNFNTNLTAGQMNQYGVGRPLQLDTGRAQQLAFNNQVQQQTLQNQVNSTTQNQQFALGQQQLQAQVGQNALQDLLTQGGQNLTQQQINLSALAYTKMTADQQAQYNVQYFQTFGTLPPASITSGQGTGTSGTATPTALTGGTTNMTANDMVGYNLSSYATDPNYASKIAANYQQATSTIGSTISPQSIQNYIDKIAPNAPVTGQMIYNAALNGGGTGAPVDPYLLAAQEAVESKFGTTGEATTTMNPANVGNTDSGATQTMPSWQAGVNAQAAWLANHPAQTSGSTSSIVNQSISSVQSFLPPAVSQSVQAMPNGIPYINLGNVPSNLQTMVSNLAQQHGIKAFTADQVSGLESLGAVSQALNGMTTLVTQQLMPANGGLGTAGNVIKNWWGSVTGTNPALAQFQTYSDSAIKSVQALAGGQGSGLRLNIGTISNAVNNWPTQNDSLETALQKIATLRTLLNNQMGQIFGNSDLSKGVAQYNGQTLMPGDVVGNINGQTGTVQPDGTITPN